VPRPVPAVFFQTETGREPVRDWLKDLPKDERRIIGEDIMTVQFRWPLGMPLVDNLGSGIGGDSEQTGQSNRPNFIFCA
jgi:hypothetical protein